MDTLNELAARCGTDAGRAAAAQACAGLAVVEDALAARLGATDQGLDELGDVIFRLASLDFSPKLEVTGSGTALDGIRGCVNMLSEELEARHRELVEARDLAEGAGRAKSEFLANMSHELRTPMHAILNYAELGLDRLTVGTELDRPKLQKYLGNIRISGQRLLSLINDLLDLSKLEAGKMRCDRERSDFMTVISQTVNALDPLFRARSIEVLVRRDGDGDGRVDADFDRERMLQVMQNVLGNAQRFAIAGSTVLITLRDAPDALVCSVHNRGARIPEGELESIFDKFVQSSKVKNGAGGTGLGLAICRAAMDLHGGRIWAENSDDGVTMHIALPRSPVL